MATKKPSEPITIDPSTLSPEKRRKLDKALAPERDTTLSLRFAEASIESWKAAAKKHDMSLTDWIEQTLNAEAR